MTVTVTVTLQSIDLSCTWWYVLSPSLSPSPPRTSLFFYLTACTALEQSDCGAVAACMCILPLARTAMSADFLGKNVSAPND